MARCLGNPLLAACWAGQTEPEPALALTSTLRKPLRALSAGRGRAEQSNREISLNEATTEKRSPLRNLRSSLCSYSSHAHTAAPPPGSLSPPLFNRKNISIPPPSARNPPYWSLGGSDCAPESGWRRMMRLAGPCVGCCASPLGKSGQV